MDSDTRALLDTSLERVLTEPSDAPLASRLDDLGWSDVLADDASAARRALFTIKGATLSSADALGPELAQVLATTSGDPSFAAATVALPVTNGPAGLARWDGATARLHINALATAPPSGDRLVVPVADDAPSRLAVVSLSADGVTVQPVAGGDPWLGLVRITGSPPSAAISWLPSETAAVGWEAVVAHGRWLLAAELVGLGERIVAMAVDYTKNRVQYGKPIGVFQALQHRLGAAHALVVGAGDLVDDAAESGDAWAATVAKCLAGRAAENATVQAQQCFGAIGFTWEHDLHRYIKRAYVLDNLLGDWRTLEHEIGETILRTGVVPMLGSL